MPRRARREVKTEMTPLLDTLVILISMICLLLIIIIIPIIQNPRMLSILSFPELRREAASALLKPIYLDCWPDGAVIIPGDIRVSLDDFRRPGNAVEAVLQRVQQRRGDEYIVLLARPNSAPVFRHLRQELIRRQIDYGSDVLDADTVLDWRARMRQLNIREGEY